MTTEPDLVTRQLGANASSKTVGKAFLWSMLGNGFGQGMSLLLFLFLANFVSRESFGLMAVSLMTIEFARQLVLDPVAITLKSKPNVSERDLDHAFTFVLMASVLIAILLAALAVPLARLLGTPDSAKYLPFIAPILVGYALTMIHDVWLSRSMNYRALALRSMLAVLSGGVVGVWMALNGFEIWSLIGQQLAINIASVVTLWLATSWRPKLVLSLNWIRSHSKQAIHNSICNLWNALSQDSAIYFVSAFLGPVAAGLYNAARRILLAATITLTFTIQSVSTAALANIGDERQRAKSMLAGLSATCLVTMPAFTGLSLVSSDVVSLVLPSQWQLAGTVLSVISFGGIALTLHTLGGAILNVAQRADLHSLSSGVTAFVAVAALFFVSEFGLTAIAWAVVATSFVTLPLRYYLVQRRTSVTWPAIGAAIAPGLAASAVMYGATSLAAVSLGLGQGLVALSFDVLFGIASYLFALRIFSRRHFTILQDSILQIRRRGR
ncbi:oligosaccharide flippase family protein [Altererythrobacter sp. Z27]|uniref:oligosaccharide flippase family protein n=1 Tax=Altererythrobacter sp. Z27 TaxID=3461147 RepID=UPI004044A6D4